MNWKLLASAWCKDFSVSVHTNDAKLVSAALQRSLPLLQEGPTSVPFVCRYRVDLIQPLSTPQIHELCDRLVAFKSLDTLRNRVLEKLPPEMEELRRRVETSYQRTELEDIFAPYKPPSKGSLEDRIRNEHPELLNVVDMFWNDSTSQRRLVKKLHPREAAVVLLANRIAAHRATTDAVLENVRRHCRVQTKQVSTTKVDNKPNGNRPKRDASNKYTIYHDFSGSLEHIRDHQVLAIRRGVAQKSLRLSYDIDGDRVESLVRRCLVDSGVLANGNSHHESIWKEAIHDAWSRLLRRRCTARLWTEKSQMAEQRSIQVFCDNLYKALLQPPIQPRPVLALDPGFQAGIKCALLDQHGQLLSFDKAEYQDKVFPSSLTTVSFLPNREAGVQKLVSLLQAMHCYQEKETGSKDKDSVTVALGNGHGSQDARALIQDASGKSGVPVDVEMVNEAGASVWSVTEDAFREFPNQSAASIASVSIGRRFQNALPELVKIPPRSLGLGMYQHDLNEKVLDEKLHYAAVNAVAEVGVDGNSCSIQILEKVPGLTKKLCERIIEARPLKSRSDLRDRISGLGAKTFENCAAFIRIQNDNKRASSVEPLDATMVHPESYSVARFILKELRWSLDERSSINTGEIPRSTEERQEKWKGIIEAVSNKFTISQDRVLSVIDHLIVSMTNPDPRLVDCDAKICGGAKGCQPLPSNLSNSSQELQAATPLRGVIGTVRNVVDFGAFVDIGTENDGLLHVSKLGSTPLSALVVGQELGVDILAVSSDNRISLGMNGLNLLPDPVRAKRANKELSSSGHSSKRGFKTMATSGRKRQRTRKN